MLSAEPGRPPSVLRWLPSPMFGVVLVSLVLPFVSVSCQSGETEVEVLRFHGYDLLTGGEPALNPDVEPALGEEGVKLADLGPQPFAIAMTILAALGIGVGLLNGPRARIGVLVVALLGLGSLLALRFRVGAQVREEATTSQDLPATLSTDVESGFWIAFAGFGLAMGSGVALIVANAPPRRRITSPRAPSPY